MSPVDTLPARAIHQLVHTSWTAKDGAPADIRALAQTREGYLWLGTDNGLFRFDGVRFVRIAPPAGDSLAGTAISSLLTTKDGSLWIVWANGKVSRQSGGKVVTFGPRDGLPPAFHLAESSRGVLLAGTAGGISRFSNGRWQDAGTAWGLAPGLEGRSIWFDRDDVMWVETVESVLYLPAGASHLVETRMVLRDRPTPAKFAQQRDGTVWMNESSRSAHTLRLATDTTYPSEVRVRATSVLIDRHGSLWIGSAGDGLRRLIDPARFKGKVILRTSADAEQFTTKDGLLSDEVTDLFEDREGDLWVASPVGLERFRQGAFTPVALPHPTHSRFVFAGRDSSLWIAAEDVAGLVRLTHQGSSMVSAGFAVTNLAQDSSGAIYSVRTHRILKLQGAGFVALPLRKIIAIDLIGMTIDPQGTIWLLDEVAGLLRLDHDRLIPVATLYEPVARRGTLSSDSKGRLWIGQLNRVALYDHGKLNLYGEAAGVPAGLVLQVFEDHAGKIWAVGEGGVSRFENGRFRSIAVRQGVPGKTVFGVAEDKSGAWWMVTRTGVLRLPPGEADRALTDSTYNIRYRTFDREDGLPGTVTVSDWGSPVTRAQDGTIWVATDSGVASVDPRGISPDRSLPVLIESVRVDGRDLSPTNPVPIPAGGRDLEIDYTATSLANPDRVQFRYRLEGEDSTWHDVGTQRRVTYNDLGPGDYRFRIAARNRDGVWDETGSAWTFRVLPPWYQTRWFQLGTVLVIVGFATGTIALVQRQRHLRAQELLRRGYEATLAERARIAQDLHDTLLQGIAGVSMQLKAAERALPDEPDLAAEMLAHVQRLTRQALREARERVMDLHETDLGQDDLAGALAAAAAELVASTGIHLAISSRGERRRVSREVEIAAIRIGREAIANAVRHAEAQRIDIVVDFAPTVLRLEVCDDGKGFTFEDGEQAQLSGHLGLSGMRSRADRLGGHCEVRPRAGGGTVVAVELPLPTGPT
ncbi:MAG: two-component regulator propeller domain-containing protein [Gemmatimonadota bacterium]